MAVQKRNDEQADFSTGDKVQNRGELHLSHRNVAAGFNLTRETVYLCTGGGAGIVGQLPAAANQMGKTYCVKKIDAGAGGVLVQRAGADLIDGAPNVNLPNQWDYIWLVSDGVSNWYLV